MLGGTPSPDDRAATTGAQGTAPAAARGTGPAEAPGADPDPDRLLLELRRAGGEPPLPPLRLAEPSSSVRRGPAGGLVSGLRRAVVRLITPSLGDLLGQLERDRHRLRAEIARLEKRVADLERGTDR